MKASSFYRNVLLNDEVFSHDKKFDYGKNLYEDLLAEYLISKLHKILAEDPSILELGTFTGRITKKIEKYFLNITVSDVDPDLIQLTKYPKKKIDLSIINRVNNKVDCVISLGHQVSFSGCVQTAINNISKYLKKGGVALFDIWNAKEKYYTKHLLPYDVDKISREECSDLCHKCHLDVLDIYYGPRIHNLMGKYSNYIISKMVKRDTFRGKAYINLEFLFLRNKSRFLESLTQSLYFLVVKKK